MLHADEGSASVAKWKIATWVVDRWKIDGRSINKVRRYEEAIGYDEDAEGLKEGIGCMLMDGMDGTKYRTTLSTKRSKRKNNTAVTSVG